MKLSECIIIVWIVEFAAYFLYGTVDAAVGYASILGLGIILSFVALIPIVGIFLYPYALGSIGTFLLDGLGVPSNTILFALIVFIYAVLGLFLNIASTYVMYAKHKCPKVKISEILS